MAYKSIEARIRQYYVAEDGEWLVESGRAKEAKMLKEACVTIEGLRKSYENSVDIYYSKLSGFSRREGVIKEREEAVAEGEGRLRNRLEQAKQGLELMIERLEKQND